MVKKMYIELEIENEKLKRSLATSEQLNSILMDLLEKYFEEEG